MLLFQCQLLNMLIGGLCGFAWNFVGGLEILMIYCWSITKIHHIVTHYLTGVAVTNKKMCNYINIDNSKMIHDTTYKYISSISIAKVKLTHCIVQGTKEVKWFNIKFQRYCCQIREWKLFMEGYLLCINRCDEFSHQLIT